MRIEYDEDLLSYINYSVLYREVEKHLNKSDRESYKKIYSQNFLFMLRKWASKQFKGCRVYKNVNNVSIRISDVKGFDEYDSMLASVRNIDRSYLETYAGPVLQKIDDVTRAFSRARLSNRTYKGASCFVYMKMLSGIFIIDYLNSFKNIKDTLESCCEVYESYHEILERLENGWNPTAEEPLPEESVEDKLISQSRPSRLQNMVDEILRERGLLAQ